MESLARRHPRRIEFVILRTASSPPVALHPASQRRSYLRLQGLAYPDTDFHRAVCTPSRAHDSRLRGNDEFLEVPLR